ncbi:MAG: sodium:solute symporter family protein [Planctomycetes bacterium]|nr:sodium:solute symporter family protein [Planctomycetota bacterium]
MSLAIITLYLILLILLGVFSGRILRLTGGDYFLASRGIGSFMLLMTLFGTTMTAFAMIGSTGETFERGIGVYGLMASWSGIVHSAIFFLIGARIWAFGKKYDYVTQISFFRDRYQSDALALLLFPIMVGLVLIYMLTGVIGAGRILESTTAETWSLRGRMTAVALASRPADLQIPDAWKDRLRHDTEVGQLVLDGSIAPKRKPVLLKFSASPEWKKAVEELFQKAPAGALPYWAGMVLTCVVVLFYIFCGGLRAAAWANTLQNIISVGVGLIAFLVITHAMGGPAKATELLAQSPASNRMAREGLISRTEFLTYFFIPLSVAMFPHLFQHWLTARRASSFKLTVAAFPVCILLTWLPCVLIGMWAAGVLPHGTPSNAVLGIMISRYSGEFLTGLIGAGVLAAIMSGLDAQFLCVGSLFTHDIVQRYVAHRRLGEREQVFLGRVFVVIVVLISVLIGWLNPKSVFDLGVWCFTGFAALSPLAFAAVYWKRSNWQGALACVLTAAALWLYFLRQALDTSGAEAFLLAGGVMPVTLILAASTAALVIVSLLTPPPDPALVARFFPPKNAA